MKNGALFRTVRVAVVLLVSVVIAVVLVKMRPRAKKQDRTSEVRLVEVVRTRSQTLPMVIDAYGTVASRQSLKLVAEVNGQVVAMNPAFIEGGLVTSGEILVTIDPRDYELAVRRAKVGIRQAQAELDRLKQEVLNLNASLKLARSDMDLTLAEVNRMKKLAGMDVTPQSVLDKADRQYLTSRERVQTLENQLTITVPDRIRLESQLEMAIVAMEQAMLNLERCEIDAPFDAWVTEKLVESGQHMTVGQPVGSIYLAGAFDIEVKIGVGDLAWFPRGEGSEGKLPVEVTFAESLPPKQWNGHVARVKAVLDKATRTLPVVIEVDQPPNSNSMTHGVDRMKPGMFVTVKIQGREVENVHRLPRHLVNDDDTVFLAVDEHAIVQPVTILRRFEKSVLISDGLSEGNLVITTPLSGAVSGMRIRRVED